MGELSLVVVATLIAALVVAIARRDHRRKASQGTPISTRLRRGTGHALLGLQQFLEPSVEHVFQSQNVEQKDDEDDDGQGTAREAIAASLTDALAQSPVDTEEIRRQLALAVRSGHDWRELFDRALADELRARPFRAPSMPPAGRVAPRE